MDATQTQNLPFSLQEGEKIIETVKPAWQGFLLKNLLGTFLGYLIIIGYISLIIGIFSVVLLILVIIVAAILAYATAVISYGKYQYWITNMRVIGSRGFISYSTDSLPMEMIADVVVQRGIIDRILNLSSIFIMPIGGAGMMNGRRGLGGTNYLQALTQDQAMKLQKEILDLRNVAKKGQKSVF